MSVESNRWFGRASVDNHQECLNMFKHSSAQFLQHYISDDETWTHHYIPETKQQSKQWVAVFQKRQNVFHQKENHGHVFVGCLYCSAHRLSNKCKTINRVLL